jgi:hypothetical protein
MASSLKVLLPIFPILLLSGHVASAAAKPQPWTFARTIG